MIPWIYRKLSPATDITSIETNSHPPMPTPSSIWLAHARAVHDLRLSLVIHSVELLLALVGLSVAAAIPLLVIP